MPLAAPLAFLRYGSSFSYNIPLANGMYSVWMTLTEPNKTAAGQRVFTITANGQTSAPLDVFTLAGGVNKPYVFPMLAFVGAGVLHLQFAATAGNAIVSEIFVSPLPFTWSLCADATGPIPSCATLQLVRLVQSDGSNLMLWAFPAAKVLPSSSWPVVLLP
jgi:hypothetical protein